ncbi:hypothetical protein Tsubulata_002067 [Turnera subulata]|uniref:Homeobox domain-containing protein n=1 Tax=Turnera subulata TaxID=218843 RepID=A0A9Q0JGN4_9ROSI|nr:hypothetical protein Tsubulata_002067 [Turnera subulata]
MASSNRHWPSMFKTKPCNAHHHQWQHDINTASLMAAGCHRPPHSSVPGCEERSPEPKPRWNPKPEQIRILEAIFNSGMVNPPREEIRKIRAQLQEYGQVGDANVFYWFQNRKSRSKHKLRNLQSKQQTSHQQHIIPQITPPSTTTTTTTTILPAPSSSSSSSEKSSPRGSKRTLSLSSGSLALDHQLSNSPTSAVSQTYFQGHNEFLHEPFSFPVQQPGAGAGSGAFAQGFCFSDLTNVVQVQDHAIGPCTSLLLSEIMNSGASKKSHAEKMMKMQSSQLSYNNVNTIPVTNSIGLAPLIPSPTNTTDSATVTSAINQIQGDQSSPVDSSSGGAGRSTVFINDVAFDVAAGPFNVREAFGDDVMLLHSSGQPVLTNEWGVTLQSLQHGSFYYLAPLSMPQHLSITGERTRGSDYEFFSSVADLIRK